jgi:hypothetical protein
MTVPEALALLDALEKSDKPSRVNPNLSRAQVVEIVRAGIQGPRALSRDGMNLDPLMEKRVLQVSRNRRCL